MAVAWTRRSGVAGSGAAGRRAVTNYSCRIMAARRDLATEALRIAGRIDVTEATRWAGRSMDRPFTLL
jgi:hypothetical protein